MEDTGAAESAAAASTNLYDLDLVSLQSMKGLIVPYTRAFLPAADEITLLGIDGVLVTKKTDGGRYMALLDRSCLHVGQAVVSVSDVGGQIGVVTNVTTMLDLVQLNHDDEATGICIEGVPPSGVRRVRALSFGDYVVSGPWLGRVVEVSMDVDVMFDDGTICRITSAESKDVESEAYYRPQMNTAFYPGERVFSNNPSAVFRGSRWLNGHWKPGQEEGTVINVEMAGVLVYWIASAYCGVDQQLVQEYAPPAYQKPHDLTFYCSASDCSWAVADRCFLGKSFTETDSVGDAASVPLPDHHDQDEHSLQSGDDTSSDEEHDEASSEPSTDDEQQIAPPGVLSNNGEEMSYRKQLRKPMFVGHRRTRRDYGRLVPPPTMAVSNTHTTVDVLWQDGTRQHGAPSKYLNPFKIMNEHEVFPGQYVVDNAPMDDDAVAVGAASESLRRIGVVTSLNSKDHTVHVSWFKPGNWEVECNDTVSAYDLGRDPDHSIFYGDVVVRLPSNISGETILLECKKKKKRRKKKRALANLSWVGRVVDLHDGHVQVSWGDGSTSTVLPHQISVANKQHYKELQAEMGDWVEEDHVHAPQELVSATTDNDPHEPVDARNFEGGGAQGGDGSMNESNRSTATRTGRLGGFIQSMIREAVQILARGKWYLVNWSSAASSNLPQDTHNVEVSTHVSTGNQEEPSIVGHGTEASFPLVTRKDQSVDDDDYAKDVGKATTTEDVPSNFPHFNVVQSPPDHHYLDIMDQGCSGEKKWVKMVQKEWKILENSLPDTIYVQAFEDRMDLLRAAMVGASGTPYEDGLFFFDLQLPPFYPAVPPQVYYHSFGLRLNPNLYASGTVCLSLLNTFGGEGTEVWSPGMSSLLQVLVSIQALVLNGEPYYNEAGYETLVDTPEGHRNALPYKENAFLLTLRTALNLLRRPPKGFEEFVRDHFRQRAKYALERCEAYLRGCVSHEGGSMKLPCSSGFRIALANMLPRLVAAFTKIGCDATVAL